MPDAPQRGRNVTRLNGLLWAEAARETVEALAQRIRRGPSGLPRGAADDLADALVSAAESIDEAWRVATAAARGKPTLDEEVDEDE